MADLRNTKRLKQLAGVTAERCCAAGVTLFPDQAAEILARRVQRVATQMGISERYTLDRYFDQDSVTEIADGLVRRAEEDRRQADATEPLTLSVKDAARVCAAFGVVIKLAIDQLEDAESLGRINTAADATALFGLEIAESTVGEITLAGQDVVWPRTLLNRVLGKLRTGEWSCICDSDHEAGPCNVQKGLVDDLGRLGSWVSTEVPPVDSHSPEQKMRMAQLSLLDALDLDADDEFLDEEDDDSEQPEDSP